MPQIVPTALCSVLSWVCAAHAGGWVCGWGRRQWFCSVCTCFLFASFGLYLGWFYLGVKDSQLCACGSCSDRSCCAAGAGVCRDTPRER